MVSGRFSNIVVIFIGLSITATAFFFVRAWEKEIVGAEIERHISNHSVDLQTKINLHIEVLESVASLFQVSDKVERSGFRDFVTPILHRYPEVQGYSWNPVVKEGQRDEFEKSAHRQGLKDFQITEITSLGEKTPAARRDKYVPVYYLEPLSGNEQALGYDIFSEKKRRKALEEARDKGTAITTNWIRLVQEKGDQFGVLVVRPIFISAAMNRDVQEGEGTLRGYVVGVFRIGDMIEEALRPSEPAGLDFWVYEGAEPQFPAMSYYHPSRSRKNETKLPGFEKTDEHNGDYYLETLQLPGKTWSIVYKTAPAIYETHNQYTAMGILIAGLALTTLTGFYTFAIRRQTELTNAHNKALRHKIVERERAELALRESESHNRMLFEKSAIGLVLSDIDGNLMDINIAFATILDRTLEEAKALNYWEITGGAEAEIEKEQFVKLDKDNHYGPYEKMYIRKDGSLVPVRQIGRTILRGDKKYIWSSVEDITDYKIARERVEHMAFHDTLTNLPNRKLLHDRLEQAICLASRNKTCVAVLFLDIDRFKTINDSLGHKIGDQLLIQVAQRLTETVRQSDTVARFGGDEFVIVAEDISGVQQVDALAKSIVKSFTNPFQVGIHQLFTTTSIGISMSSLEYSKAEELISHADIAMYGAKGAGRNTYRYHVPEMGKNAAAKADMERDLRGALERQEFLVYLQPITNLETLQPTGFEALMRWQHPERGLVNPGDFIPIMEDTGMIVPATCWILQESCRVLSEFRKQTNCNLSIAVNLSAPCFYDSGLVNFVQHTLESNALTPQDLILEITESTLFHDPGGVRPAMDGLKALGVRIALDDFGTGQSSLNHLRNFPIDIVKIDREFVRNIPKDTNDCELVSAIIAMAHNLNMKVVAEGVEQDAQLHYLQERQCDRVQGYLFSPPAPVAEACSYLIQSMKTVAN